jgi:hypothetical protein
MHDGAVRVTAAAPTHFKPDARQLGIDEVIQIPREPADAPLSIEVRPEGHNVVVATAVPGVFEIATPLTRDGGTVLWYGVTTRRPRCRQRIRRLSPRDHGQGCSPRSPARQAVLALQHG